MRGHLNGAKTCVAVCVLLILAAAELCGQNSVVKGTRQIEKIPRRVLFEVSSLEDDRIYRRAGLPFVDTTEEVLYTAIASRVSIVKTESPEKAHNTCRVDVQTEDEQNGGEKSLQVAITLDGRDGGVVYRSEYEFRGDMEAYTTFLERTSKEMYAHLGLVEPQVKLSSRVENEEERQLAEELSFAEKLARPLELSTSLGIVKTDFSSEHSKRSPTLSAVPIFLEAAWYPGNNSGLLVSLMGDLRDTDTVQGEETFLGLGLGYSYRSLSRVSLEFDFVLYGVGVFGSEASRYYSLMGIRPSLSYNFSPRFGVSLNPFSFYGSIERVNAGWSEDIQHNILFARDLGLSFTYRPNL